jgi:hypothetical protein
MRFFSFTCDHTICSVPLPSAASLYGKAQAVIGMRRAGKTFFLYQCLADRLAHGVERERLV